MSDDKSDTKFNPCKYSFCIYNDDGHCIYEESRYKLPTAKVCYNPRPIKKNA